MAKIKDDFLIFNDGTSIDLQDRNLGINTDLDIVEGYDRFIFSYHLSEFNKEEKMLNVYHFTKEQAIELADLMTGLWQQFKDKVSSQGLQLDKTKP